MKREYTKGSAYMSTSHGLVEYKGLDHYMGQTTLMFYSSEYGMQYWLPASLKHHFKEEQDS
ncbi:MULTISPECIES: hypothetical protein [unclassified Neptuniibacter]|uniref:hypothetical protein n=1 Tax=unclassified Neptuniibacter TaxID=2630693 RepID=UPI0025FA4607|nr:MULTISPECIES: hypothetical protein [unclassified Neptuniibacter]|tara:strand:+ start:2205 stop:2387 length:183 start_codon:yes stop_codon:yes gene_type:complete